MDYTEIDQVLLAKGLLKDPAFGDELAILIEPTPNLNGCPLGLYYPDEATIIIPPDATHNALLHELGHRHGHYYYDDLSERYAEDFRKIYQPKGRALLYTGNHFENMPRFGVLFEEGEKGAVEIATLYPLTPDDIYEIRYHLHSYSTGEGIPKVIYGGGDFPFVRMEFTKGVDWMVVIGSVMVASVIATVGAVGYAIYKVSAELPWVVPVSLLGTGLFFLLRAMTREAKKYAPARP